MALVAYEYSDSESESGKEDKNNEIEQSSVSELLSSLPKPKQQAFIEEEDDVLMTKNEPKLNGTKKTVKISIPALSNYYNDEEEPPKKIIAKALIKKSSGLFSVLPTPKSAPNDINNQKFNANVIKQKNLLPRSLKTKSIAKIENYSDDVEISSSNFFSLTETTRTDAKSLTLTGTIGIQVDSAKPVKDSNSFFSNLVASAAKVEAKTIIAEEEALALEENAVEELCGKRSKKSKKNKINFIDINAADVMLDQREWRVKALTEEAPTPTVKKGEEPSSQSRRKHQITYLAYQAKVNEQEFKNQWALSRMSRKQTQAKYGF